jgi:phage baseplate assembly protein W
MGIFGADVRVFPVFDPSMSLTDDDGVVLPEAVLKRLSTQKGTLSFHPDYGYDLRALLLSRIDQDALYRIKNNVERECEEDERILSATAQVSFNTQTKTLTVTIALETDAGPFTLVLEATQLTVRLVTEKD